MASAKNRDGMHSKGEDLSESMRMYRWGLEGGKPMAGTDAFSFGAGIRLEGDRAFKR